MTYASSSSLTLYASLLTLQVYDAMAIGDMSQVMNTVVNKLCSNIKYWHKSDEILEQTLEAFVELTVTSYSSSKTLLTLETVNFLVHNHVGAHFPFLSYDNDNKYRVTFYSALSRLVFSSSEDLNNSFDTFIAPNLEIIAQLSQTAEIRTPAVKIAIVGALRDLRGVTESTYNKRTYNLLFDALYPDAFPLLVRVAETWYDDATVMTALLKFMKVRAALSCLYCAVMSCTVLSDSENRTNRIWIYQSKRRN